jgi:hypothetical protein
MKWRWRKIGRIFNPAARGRAGSYAQVPTATVLEDRVRIFYADRTATGKSFIAWIDVSRRNPMELLDASRQPAMPFGERGMFDDEGMMPGDTVRNGGRLWLYYTGWNQGVTVPYRNSIGLAASDDDGITFTRMFRGPVLDRTAEEPLMAVTPFILRENKEYRMWYVSGTQWADVDGKLEPVYVIRHASSTDGLSWQRSGAICVPQRHELEAHAHPTVIRTDDVYRMWFCYRDSKDFRDGAGSYRIGYAESDDGVSWVRKDERSGIDLSADGWDSTMLCYPYVTEFGGATHMFYNGNSFGRSGIGYAILED